MFDGKVIENNGSNTIEVKLAIREKIDNNNQSNQFSLNTNKLTLYIRNLPLSLTQKDLEQLFSHYGALSSARLNENGIAVERYVLSFEII